ncbi:hypothetical protein DPMN_031961 [Dreissena polymorpha]|uniref:Uncharacterized protein n=1 Tax=Dreissena polymorpha TaxID=45954 RepID=A0A9D4M0W4_DREPO|nr:hypothetical protein DPMN_031961 [Dreissena polymorpha]
MELKQHCAKGRHNITRAAVLCLTTQILIGLESANALGEVPLKSRRLSLEIEKCILCERETPKTDLRKAMTMNINRRLNECARTLNDGKVLATPSGGDAVVQELKYH